MPHFWSLTLEPGKLYKAQLQRPLNISKVVLETTGASKDDKKNLFQVHLIYMDQIMTVASLCIQRGILQASLCLEFSIGETIGFTICGGDLSATLFGKTMDSDDEANEEESDDEIEQEENVGYNADAEIAIKSTNNVTASQNKRKLSSSSEDAINSYLMQRINSIFNDYCVMGTKAKLHSPVSPCNFRKKIKLEDSGEASQKKKSEGRASHMKVPIIKIEYGLGGVEKSNKEKQQQSTLEDMNKSLNATSNKTSKSKKKNNKNKTKEVTDGGSSSKVVSITSESGMNNSSNSKKSCSSNIDLLSYKSIREMSQKSNSDKCPISNCDKSARSSPLYIKKSPTLTIVSPISSDKSFNLNITEASDEQNQKKTNEILKRGVEVTDINVGSGAVVLKGNLVTIFYEGRLQSTGEVFEKNTWSAPFRFHVGRKEVIKGWDYGVRGMKVGGKRTIVVSPKMAYGFKSGSLNIPANATLVFDVTVVSSN